MRSYRTAPTIFDLPVSDGRQLCIVIRVVPFHEARNLVTPTLRMDYRFSESCIL